MKSKVYIVHELIDHYDYRILGVYTKRDVAEKHRDNLYRREAECCAFTYNGEPLILRNISVTEHVVRY